MKIFLLTLLVTIANAVIVSAQAPVVRERDSKVSEATKEIRIPEEKHDQEPNGTRQPGESGAVEVVYYEILGIRKDLDGMLPFRLVLSNRGSFEYSTSRDRTRFGFNSTVCWKQDENGIALTLSYSDRERALMFVQLVAGQLLDTPLVELESRPVAGNADREFRIKESPGQWRIKFNENGNPQDISFPTASGLLRWNVLDFMVSEEANIPKNIEISEPDGKFTLVIESCKRISFIDPAVFARPASRPIDTEFLEAFPPQLKIERANVGSVLCKLELDGHEEAWFVFDTGAGGNLIDIALADRLKMEPIRKSVVSWVGDNVEASVVAGNSLRAGPVMIETPEFHAVDLTQLRQMIDQRVVGVIGYELLSRCVCEIDLAEDIISLHNPATYSADSRNWFPLTFHENLPLIPGQFPKGEGNFRIDVGAAGGPAANAIFHAPAAQKFGLLGQSDSPVISTMNIRLSLITIPWFEIAGFRHKESPVFCSMTENGALADPYVTGNLGVEFLRPFQIVLDYQRSRIEMKTME